MVRFLGGGSKKGAVQRALAMLLLSLSFVDIAVIDQFLPERCDLKGTVVSGTGVISDNVRPDTLSTAQSTPRDHGSESIPLDEDCFCCCAHVIPSVYFRCPALRLQAVDAFSWLTFLPTAPPLETFHPPRFA